MASASLLREQLQRAVLESIAEQAVLGGGASWVFYRSFVRGRSFDDIGGLAGVARRVAA